jgi:hypothetical protein
LSRIAEAQSDGIDVLLDLACDADVFAVCLQLQMIHVVLSAVENTNG